MKPFFGYVLLAAMAMFCTQLSAGSHAQAQFEKIKSLAGEWQGEGPEGKVTVVYEVVSNGSAVMERMQSAGQPGMITMYHLDGDHLMMTHYCAAMNQPRMRAAEGADANVLAFNLMDITNLTDPAAGHMKGLTMTFRDANHLTADWTFEENGKETSGPFELERKAAAQ